MPEDSYKKYEVDCARIHKENATLLRDFERWLKDKNLSEKTVSAHIGNVEFYVNQYLLYSDITPAAHGAVHISGFLGAWFIRKALWANKSSIRANAASLKKFYTFMVERGLTSPEDLAILQEDIREEMPEWMAELRRFDNLAYSEME
ncbi:recombinase [Candidatus Peregrinibacteria bacterium CG10_big_fil_rev_8_21_14_0_10_49_16]|nr:MAG: recombinase [Candidatus Peregrinibacteria bacterium CG22_combo_CG10-13_8_21_14_all_49_11]PIR52074.1 MAG: recombinase [Candidatus Peregrinibacteria bacterium CG10_big_fil_rev_8_21_14_0_10_49_16]